MTTARSRGRKLFGYLGRIGGGLGLALGLMVGTITVSQSAFATPSTLYAAAQGTGNCSASTDACSLSTAISNAASGDTIELVTPGTSGNYNYQTISKSLTIEAAPGVAYPTIFGGYNGGYSSGLTIEGSANVTLIGIAIANNDVTPTTPGGYYGAGIFNYSTGVVTVDDSSISDNQLESETQGMAFDGGGIANLGTLIINDSTVAYNSALAYNWSADGGGIFNDGTLTVNDTTVYSNTAVGSRNVGGGGIYNYGGSVTIDNSTISDNVATLYSNGGTSKTYVDRAIDNAGGTLNLSGDLIATQNNPADECYLGTLGTYQDVVTGNQSCEPAGSTVTPLVSAGNDLNDVNSGMTSLVEPTTGNPAVGAIESSTGLCPPADQRGYVPASGATTCDVGAYQTSYVAPAITFSPASPGVVGTSDTLSATSTSPLPITFSVDDPNGVCSITGTTVTFDAKGTCAIEASQAGGMDQGYYYAPASSVSENVNVLLAQTITFSSTAPTNAQVGQTYTPAAKSSSGLTVSFAVSPSSVCSISGGVVSFTGAGTCTVTASQGGNGEYAPASTTQGINVSQATQTINFSSSAPTNAQVGQTYTPAAKSSSGLTVSFAVSPSSVCSISSGVVSFTGAGTCSVTASQGGSGEYAPASTTQNVNVVAVPVTSTSSTTPTSTKPSSTTPSTPAPKTSSSTTSTPITKPQSVTIKTGPPVAPSTTTPMVPIGLGLGVSGVLGIFGLNRKRRRTS